MISKTKLALPSHSLQCSSLFHGLQLAVSLQPIHKCSSTQYVFTEASPASPVQQLAACEAVFPRLGQKQCQLQWSVWYQVHIANANNTQT